MDSNSADVHKLAYQELPVRRNYPALAESVFDAFMIPNTRMVQVPNSFFFPVVDKDSPIQSLAELSTCWLIFEDREDSTVMYVDTFTMRVESIHKLSMHLPYEHRVGMFRGSSWTQPFVKNEYHKFRNQWF